MDFSQKRQTFFQKETQAPFMLNEILYKGFVWNIVEIASFREQLKIYDLDLLESFIDEISSIKEDLLYYVNNLHKNKKSENQTQKEISHQKNKQKFLNKNPWGADEKQAEHNIVINKLECIETVWKCYKIFKTSFGYSTY